MTQPHLRILLLIALAALVIACSRDDDRPSPTATPEASASPTAQPSPRPASTIDWSPCGSFQCGNLNVPLDHADASKGEMTLALQRLPATDPSRRIGSLLVNPGGPGGSAIDFLRVWVLLVPAELRARFDLVAFDPRGVGQSAPIRCGVSVPELLAWNPDPTTDEDWQTIEAQAEAFTEQCEAAAGAALPYYGTENVARDMDLIRAALGDEKLTYLGYSYGTAIGQVYADLFPDRVRAMVLDGAVDYAIDADERNLDQTLAFEAAFQRFLEYCRDTACFDQDPLDAVNALIAQAEAAPIPAPGADRPLSEGEVVWGVISSLYSRFTWAGLANAISDGLEGDGSTMLRLVDNLWGRERDGSYSNLFDANAAVNCLDQPVDRDPAHYRELAQEFAAQAPLLGAFTGSGGLLCAYWDADPTPIRVPKAEGAPPIVVIGNTGDPATPYKWSVGLSRQLASAVLLTVDREGHTAYLQGDPCVDNVVSSYLLDLTPPSKGGRCGNAGITPVPAVP